MSLTETCEIERGECLVIEAGVEILAASNASLVIEGELLAEGLVSAPITFRAADSLAGWGGLHFRGERFFDDLCVTGRLMHCVFEHGNASVRGDGAVVFGDYSDVVFSNCVFRDCEGTVIRLCDSLLRVLGCDFSNCGEAVNAVRCNVRIEDSDFNRIRHGADAIDVDLEWSGWLWSPAVVTGNRIAECSGDGIDLGGSAALVSGNLIRNCADKGISVGEGSNGRIENNVIMQCRLGIAVKDGSAPIIANNTVIGCRAGISCYEKDPGMSGARGHVVNSVVWGCDEGVVLDDLSLLDVQYSLIQGSSVWPGVSNVLADPMFVDLPKRDVRPDTGSSLLGRGTSLRGATSDYHGVARNGAPSIGAFEDGSGLYDSDSDGVQDSNDEFPFHAEWSVDADHDDLPDVWETQYFSGLIRDGAGDFDGDGVDDQDEFLWGLCPTNGESSVCINEIMFHPFGDVNAHEYIELYNRSAQAVDLSGWYLVDEVLYAFPEGTVLAAGSYLIVAGDPAAVELEYGVSGVQGPWEGTLGDYSAVVRLVAPNQVGIDTVEYKTFGDWPAEPDGTGVSLELMHPAADNNRAENWAAGRLPGGTPGRVNDWVPVVGETSTYTGTVVITEIMYHPASDEKEEEFIEIHNTSVSDVDLTGWSFTDGILFDFVGGTVCSAGQFLVIGHEPEAVTNKYSISGVLGPFQKGKLSNAGEQLVLCDGAGLVVDQVHYLDRGRWPRAADGDGPSLELVDFAADNSIAAYWGANVGSEGSPGSANFTNTTGCGIITAAGHFPVRPSTSETVTVRAHVEHSHYPVVLMWKCDDDGTFNQAVMTNDGSGYDVLAAEIPEQADHTLVEYYIASENSVGGKVVYPLGAPAIRMSDTGNDVPYTFRYLVQDDPATSALPSIQILMSAETKSELVSRNVYSDELLPVTMVYLDEVFPFARLRYRGTLKRLWPIKSYRIDLSYDHDFADESKLNLNGRRPAADYLANEVFRQQGFATLLQRNVQLYQNETDQGHYLLAERVGGDYLERNFPDDDPEGEFYEGWGQVELEGGVILYPDAVSNRLAAVGATNTSGYVQTASMAVDVDQWLDWLVWTVLVGDYETLLGVMSINHACYIRGDNGRMLLEPLDMDATFENYMMTPHVVGSAQYWTFDCQMLDAFMRYPVFMRRYYQKLADALDGAFAEGRLSGAISNYFDVVGDSLGVSKAGVLQYLTRRHEQLEQQLSNLVWAATGLEPIVPTMTNDSVCWLPYADSSLQGIVVEDIADVLVDGATSGVTLDSDAGIWRYTPAGPVGELSVQLAAVALTNRDYVVSNRLAVLRYDGGDTDLDGLPNSWELAYGLDPDDDGSGFAVNGGQADEDGDGVSNLGELEGRTDPSRYDNVVVSSVAYGGVTIDFTWKALPGTYYQLEASDTLTGSWSSVGAPMLCTTPNGFRTVNPDEEQKYYRIIWTSND